LIPQSIAALIDQLRSLAHEEKLSSTVRREVTSAVRRALLPRGKKSNSRDSAYDDYKRGMRGLPLYRKHIPGYEKLGPWRRERAQRQLRQALAKRAERERKRQKTATNEPSVAMTS
jgi:hypothetical protein